MEYTIDHPRGEEWFPEGDYRVSFTSLLKLGSVGRWEIDTRDGRTVIGAVNGEYRAPPLEHLFFDMSNIVAPSTPYLMTRTLRWDSQRSPFIYNIKELRLFTDSTGKEKPEHIISRPDISTTNVMALRSSGRYEEISNIDVGRPEPAFLMRNP